MAIEKMLVTSSSPHAHNKGFAHSTSRIMWTVVCVLSPAAVFAVISFGLRAALTLLLTIGAAVASEAAWQAARKKAVTIKDGSAVLTGLLLALNLPPAAPWWLCLVGGFIAMILGKAVFGGLGQNPFNPALTARVFLLIAFPVPMTQWLLPEILEPEVPASGQVADLQRDVPALAEAPIVFTNRQGEVISSWDNVSIDDVDIDAVTAASPLGLIAENPENRGAIAARFDVLSLFHGGGENGSLGEVSALILLLGGLALLFMRIITWHIPVSFLGTMAVFAAITHYGVDSTAFADPLFHLCAGGAMIGAWFMATDYVTSPMFPLGKIIFGVGCGVLTMVIRIWGGYPEGVSFAILLMNAAVPLIDRYTKPQKFGLERLAEAGEGN
jgi:electron transport complex protein RnfD